ncbi:hypothetical protein ACI65C_005174 [Semiaphis heraclei]
MNSDNAINEKYDIWSIEKCIYCKGNIKEDSKLLNCLHIICKDCTQKKSTDLGLCCKCNVVTKGELTDYIIVPPNRPQAICSEENCQDIGKKICMYCKSVFCKPCSKIHLTNNEDHNPVLMMSYPLKKEFVPCPKCMEKCVEVFCTKCSKMICSLCHLNFHQEHSFKLLSTKASETRQEFQSSLHRLCKNDDKLNYLMKMADEDIKRLIIDKNKISEQIDKSINMMHEVINKRSFELKKLLETNFIDAVKSINTNKEVLNDFITENEYYLSVVSSVIERNQSIDYIQLSNIINDQVAVTWNDIFHMPKEINDFKAKFEYNDEQSMKKCVEFIQGMGSIISPKIIDLLEYKKMVDKNNFLLHQKSNSPISYLRRLEPAFLQSSEVKDEYEDIEMMDEDSDSSDYEPLVSCSCCNQWTEELIRCISCERYYHNECHIPPLAEDLKPNDSSTKHWKCTICHDISKHIDNLREKDPKDRIIPIGHSERKIIERILMELYCQNEDSEHYRDCLDIEIYPQYYEKIADPISLNDIKQRLESDASYTSLIDFIKDIKKVLKNGKLYYALSHPYYKSAYQLEISLDRMISSWIPTLDLAHL